jgi:hypothetical protein
MHMSAKLIYVSNQTSKQEKPSALLTSRRYLSQNSEGLSCILVSLLESFILSLRHQTTTYSTRTLSLCEVREFKKKGARDGVLGASLRCFLERLRLEEPPCEKKRLFCPCWRWVRFFLGKKHRRSAKIQTWTCLLILQ